MNIFLRMIAITVGTCCIWCLVDDIRKQQFTWRLINIITGPYLIWVGLTILIGLRK